MYTSFSTLFVFVLAAAQLSPSLAAPIVNRATVPADDFTPTLPFITEARIPFGGEPPSMVFGRNVASLPGGSGSGVTIVGRQLPDGFEVPGGDKELPGSLKSNGIIFKRDDSDDGQRLQHGQQASGAVTGRAELHERFECGGDTGLECPTTTTPVTAPGLPVPFRELDARYVLPPGSPSGGMVYGREELSPGRAGSQGVSLPHTFPSGLLPNEEGPGALFGRDEQETPEKRVVCSTLAGVDCSNLPSPSSVSGIPEGVRILKTREPHGSSAVFGRDRIPIIGEKPVGIPLTGLPNGGEGSGAVFLGTQPETERRALFNAAGGMFGSGFLGGHDDEPSVPAGQPIDDSNTVLSAREPDVQRRMLARPAEGALWGPTARSEHDSRALNNGQIRAP